MKSITCWDHLAPFGIVPLTGEACGLSYRLLCDVTASGKRILEKALGVVELRLQENWNSGSAENPHVGSIMLAPDLLLFVGVFALLEHGCPEVWVLEGRRLVALEADESPDRVAAFQQLYADKLGRRFSYGGTAGHRNVHLMTGRVE